MKHPIWFRRDGYAHWVPCAWQGWGIIAVYIAIITAVTLHGVESRSAADAAPIVAVSVVATAALIGVVMLTDDRRR